LEPIPPLDERQRLAILLFQTCGTQWDHISGGMGPPMKSRLIYSELYDTAERVFGIEVDPEMLGLIQILEAAELNQEVKRHKALAAQPVGGR
jgi:hypothetical protein